MRISEKNDGIHFTVRVVPRASRSEVAGEIDGALKIRLASPPVEGAANAELVKLLAKLLGVPKGNVEIVSGHASRTKLLRVAGTTAEKLLQLGGPTDLPGQKSA